MEFKYLVILSVFGAAAGFAIPTPEKSQQGETSSDLESSFSSGSSDAGTVSRDKRHLLFKKLKEHHDTMFVNHRYQGSGVEYRPNREVHHHHHYSYPAPPPQTYYQPAPSQEYHHYHGASDYQQGGYSSQGSDYYTGGHSAATNYYPQQTNYGDGGYKFYGGVGGYSGPPQQQQQQQQQQQHAGPVANAHNSVDRGQGAAAVNNIAIIHARSGASNNLLESESKILPRPLPVDIEDALNMVQE